MVRNIYAFQLDLTRLKSLVDSYDSVWHDFQQDLQNF